MKVILSIDHKDHGKAGALVEVSEGYARNFLFPRKIAVEATPAALKNWEEKKKADARREEKLKAAAQELAAILADAKVTLKAKSGEGGRLFGQITAKEIAAAIKNQLGHEVDKRKVETDEAIKSLGVHNITIKLHPAVTAKMRINVDEE